ncbi:Acetyltransferase [subsurface metagenome]
MGKLSFKITANDRELKEAFEVRKKVFVEKQGISGDLEFDNCDRKALHVVVADAERVIGTARVIFLTTHQAKLEKMAVLRPFRRRGIGSRIVSFLSEELRNRQVEQVVLHAQYAVVAFYKSFGFEELGLPFVEDGIKHIKMQKWL